MLREIQHIRQVPDEPLCRWFSDSDFDLFVWLDERQQPLSFQLAYDKQFIEHALVWRQGEGLRRYRVDDGERGGLSYKATPILVNNIPQLIHPQLCGDFAVHSQNIEDRIRKFVCRKLLKYQLRVQADN